MNKTRVYQLAKELNVGNKELVETIRSLGIPINNHMSTLSDTQVQRIAGSVQEAAGERIKHAASEKDHGAQRAGEEKATKKLEQENEGLQDHIKPQNSVVERKKQAGENPVSAGAASKAPHSVEQKRTPSSPGKNHQIRKEGKAQMPNRRPDSRIEFYQKENHGEMPARRPDSRVQLHAPTVSAPSAEDSPAKDPVKDPVKDPAKGSPHQEGRREFGDKGNGRIEGQLPQKSQGTSPDRPASKESKEKENPHRPASGSRDAQFAGEHQASRSGPPAREGQIHKNSPPTKEGETLRSGSPSREGQAQRSGSPSREGQAQRSGSPSREGQAQRSGSPSREGQAQRSGSPSREGQVHRSSSPSREGQAQRSGSPSREGQAQRSGSPSREGQVSRSGSSAGENSARRPFVQGQRRDAAGSPRDARPGEGRGPQTQGGQRSEGGPRDTRAPGGAQGSRDHRRPGQGKPAPEKTAAATPAGKPTKSNFGRKKQDPKKAGDTAELRGKKTGKIEKGAGASPAYENLHKKSQGKKHRDYKNVDKTKSVEEEKLVTAKDLDGFYEIGETIVVGELARILDMPSSDVILSLMKLGIMANINQEIKFETAEKIAAEHDIILMQQIVEKEEEIDFVIEEDQPEDLKARPPIVTVMGHVDHGKTSLLDAIRHTHVTAGEAGGITQHIGASEVVVEEKKIVFLDTPGHEAFTEMRARGAQVTDLVIIVVAADDGIMPQTLEAIDHVKAADVPMIIAINKIDKPTADVDKVRHELSDKGILVETWGGDITDVEISAKMGTNIDTLLEMILLVAELEELKANPNRKAIGTVVESHLDKGRGPVATVIVQNGTLKVGDSIVAGSAFGKVRAMHNSKGKKIGKAGPSTAVEIIGLGDVPVAGDQLLAVQDEKEARALGEKRWDRRREEQMRSSSKISLEDLFSQMQKGEIKELPIIVKADVQGSIEAVRNSLEKISNEEVKVRVIHGGVGAISESDVMLASASNAIIIGFNVRPSVGAKSLGEAEKVDIRTYRVIYEAIEDVENAMKGMLAPSYVEEELGKAEVRLPFKVPKIGVIAGSYVKEGKVQRNAKVRLVRDGIVVYEGAMDSLRRFKDDVKEVATGFECGIGLVNFQDVKEGDLIECFIIKEVKAV